jgi:DHA1 family bicyclomycin/chloramphenicol resistance-like MFS transporter
MALMISLVALSIDAMLPALPEIGRDLGVQRENSSQLIITFLILGMAIGQMVYGPLSDSTGRKPAIYAGFGLYMVGCLFSVFATSFAVMLAGRLMQGMGAAGPRIVTVALIRDRYEGRAMARVMSFVMAVFILVPAIAPALGQSLLIVAHWRAIFVAFLVLALIALIWFATRQPETLALDRRLRFSLKRIMLAIREICVSRIPLGYTIATGLIFGAFLGYLSTAQQMLQEQYGLGRQFPLYFALLALALGSASFMNARLVVRYGMRLLTSWASQTLSGLSIVFFAIAIVLGGQPSLVTLMIYLMISFFCIGILFGNLNALAMEPLGHIAGVGAAVVGSFSTLISVLLGIVIGQSYNGTILPLVGGFAILSTAAVAVIRWTEYRRQVSQYGS